MTTIRVMSFNIRGSTHVEDGVNAWENRAPLNIATIKRCDPDIIGFQELQSGNLDTYRDLLPEYTFVLGQNASNEEPHDHNAICWKPSQLEMIDAGGFWLSKTPGKFSSAWEARSIRTATWARFLHLKSGLELLHVNTHLDHVSELARVEGCKLILQRIAQLSTLTTPVLVTGDFNCNPGTSAYYILVECGFIDTYLASGNREGEMSNTHHAYGWTKHATSHPHAQRKDAWRIDWLLLRDEAQRLRLETCEIIRDQQPPMYPSDHYPVLASLTIETSQV